MQHAVAERLSFGMRDVPGPFPFPPLALPVLLEHAVELLFVDVRALALVLAVKPAFVSIRWL